jgi:hypothetical protein
MSVVSPAIQNPAGSTASKRPVAAVSLLAAAAALAVIEGCGAIARASGVGLGVFWGTVLAVVFARYVRRPARAFMFVTVPLVALSLSGPLTATQATTATKVTLACAHLLAAAIILPPVARSLARYQR